MKKTFTKQSFAVRLWLLLTLLCAVFAAAHAQQQQQQESKAQLKARLETLTAKIAHAPNDDNLYVERGIIHDKLFEWYSAVNDADKALQLNPRNKAAQQLKETAELSIRISEPIIDADEFLKSITDGNKKAEQQTAEKTPVPAIETRRTVTELYLDLPDEIFATDKNKRSIKSGAALVKHRRSLITIEDVKNGYLLLKAPSGAGWGEVAIFRKDAGGYIVATTEVACTPLCRGEKEVYWEKIAGKWQNVNGDYEPEMDERMMRKMFLDNNIDVTGEMPAGFQFLPRQGRIVRMVCDGCAPRRKEKHTGESGKTAYVLLKLEWNGKRFVELD